jgi:outer membrane lipoprotein-sorting protein
MVNLGAFWLRLRMMNKQIFGIPVFSILIFFSNAVAEKPTIPSAAEIIAKVAQTYRAPQRYFMSGTVTATLRPFPNGMPPIPVIIAAEFPDKFRMEGDLSALGLKGITSIILDGNATWIYDKSSNKYYKVLRTSQPGTSGQKPEYGQLDFSKPEQVVSYMDHYLFIRYRGTYKTIASATVLGIETVPTKEKKRQCYVVQIDYGDFNSQKPGSGRNTWWVDKDRFLVWKETNAMWTGSPAFLEIQNQDFDSVLLDEPLHEKTFVFKPPKKSAEAQIPKRQ